MESMTAKRTQMTRQRSLAFAHGARSAVDLSGLNTLNSEVLRPRAMERLDPASAVARDLARVIDLFGRSFACARRALEEGLKIEDLEPGCTANGAAPEPDPLPHGQRGRAAAKSID
jgi:hypothetical protein